VVYLKQKVRLIVDGVSAVATSEVVAPFNGFTQLLGHESPLLFNEGGCREFTFQHFNQLSNSFFRHRYCEGPLCHSAARRIGKLRTFAKRKMSNIKIRATNKISTLAHSFLPIALEPLRCKGMHVKNHTENTQSPKSA
jgi:hypothetical protein